MYYFTLLEPLEVKEYSVSKTASIQVIEKSFLQPQLFCLKTSSWWFRRHKCLTIFGQYLIIQAIVIVLRGKNIIPRDRKIAEWNLIFSPQRRLLWKKNGQKSRMKLLSNLSAEIFKLYENWISRYMNYSTEL